MLGRCNISDDDMVKMLPPIPKEVGWWISKNPNANKRSKQPNHFVIGWMIDVS